MANLKVAIEIAGTDKLSSPAAKGTKSVEQLDSAVSKAAKSFSPFNNAIQTGIGLATGLRIFDTVAGAIKGAASQMTGFEKTVSGVKAVAGATADEMKSLSGLALQLGKDTAFSASAAAMGIEELLKGGVSISDVLGGAASAALNLAAAGSIELSQASEIAANAMSQFGLKGSDMAKVSDLIAGAANASSLSVGDFSMSMSQVGAVARTAGLDFDTTAQAIAVLGAAGIKGSDAGTSLKQMLLNLQPTTKAQSEEFRRLGIVTAEGANLFFDATGKAKSLADISQVLQNATRSMTDQQKLASLEILFGSDAMRAAAVMAREGRAGFEEMAGAMGKVTAAAVAAERLNNLSGDVEQLTGSLETASVIVAGQFTPALREATQAGTRLVNDFIQEASTIIQTAQNISGAHGLGLIPATLVAIENRFGEVFGSQGQARFHTFLDAVNGTNDAFRTGVQFIGEHDEAVKTLAGAYVALVAADAMSKVPSLLSTIIPMLTKINPLMLVAAAGVGAFTASLMKGPEETLGPWDHFVREIVATPGIVSKVFNDTIDDIKQWWVYVQYNFREFGTNAGKLGAGVAKAIVDGFKGALAGAQSAAATAAAGLGANAIAGLREGVEAHSPSRLAQEVGEDVGAGFTSGLETVAAAMGAIAPTIRDLVQEARDQINEDLLESDRDLRRTLELENIKHGRRMVELELDLGRSKGEEHANVLHRMEEENRAHLQRIEDAQRRHDDNLVELEYDAGARIAEATRKQAEQRGKALLEFSSAFDDLVRETESKSAEIGRKAGDAVRDAIADAGRAIADARSRAGESIQSAVEGLGLNRLLRGRRDEFSGKQDTEARKRAELREDAELERDFLLDMAAARKKYDRDRANAKTDEERGQLSDSYDLERDNLRARFEGAKADLAHRRQLAIEDRAFREKQEQERRAFDDQLENEALQRNIARIMTERDERIASITETLAQKQKALEDQEAKERETLKTSFEQKEKDLRENLIGKLGPLTAEASAALGTFLDGIAAKVSSVSAQIIGQAAAAAAAIASMGSGSQSPTETMSEVAQMIQDLAPTGLLSSAPGGVDSPTVATTGSQLGAALLNAGTAAWVQHQASLPHFAEGGMVPGEVGEPLLAMVHGREMVLNQDQQSVLRGPSAGEIAAAVAYALQGARVAISASDADGFILQGTMRLKRQGRLPS